MSRAVTAAIVLVASSAALAAPREPILGDIESDVAQIELKLTGRAPDPRSEITGRRSGNEYIAERIHIRLSRIEIAVFGKSLGKPLVRSATGEMADQIRLVAALDARVSAIELVICGSRLVTTPTTGTTSRTRLPILAARLERIERELDKK